jgi:hypothetical protein
MTSIRKTLGARRIGSEKLDAGQWLAHCAGGERPAPFAARGLCVVVQFLGHGLSYTLIANPPAMVVRMALVGPSAVIQVCGEPKC